LTIAFDGSRAPLVVLTYPVILKVEMVEEAMLQVAAVAADHGPLLVLLDYQRYQPMGMDAAARREVAAIMERVLVRPSPRVLAQARVIPDPVARSFLTSFDWFARHPWPLRNFDHAEAAERWLWARHGELASTLLT
jgi:hypothetical protein